jgi:hypothetical protein
MKKKIKKRNVLMSIRFCINFLVPTVIGSILGFVVYLSITPANATDCVITQELSLRLKQVSRNGQILENISSHISSPLREIARLSNGVFSQRSDSDGEYEVFCFEKGD